MSLVCRSNRRYFTHVYERSLTPRLKHDRHHVLLLGPRQVGKSTLLGSLEPDLTLNLASLATFREFVTQPGRLERELLAAPRATRTVLIDEVQRIPALLDGLQANHAQSSTVSSNTLRSSGLRDGRRKLRE